MTEMYGGDDIDTYYKIHAVLTLHLSLNHKDAAMGKKDEKKCCHKFEKKGKCCKGCPLSDSVDAGKKDKKKKKK